MAAVCAVNLDQKKQTKKSEINIKFDALGIKFTFKPLE